MTRDGTSERCAIQLRHLLQLLVQSPCLPRNKEENASLKSSGQDNSVVTPVKLTTAVDRPSYLDIRVEILGIADGSVKAQVARPRDEAHATAAEQRWQQKKANLGFLSKRSDTSCLSPQAVGHHFRISHIEKHITRMSATDMRSTLATQGFFRLS